MHFQRLRLSGFKSFVDPTEFRIEAGLTGIVGPNGCGKSNILEALRWVMGASSAKAMRGEGMDDVIFGGAERRPSRNHAEVLLQIDNGDHAAPAQFNQHEVIEVVRRIDRGAGSTYRVNGVETRARDVQLLFADASTGANSPSLVRQGQISELIAAKPSNRRRILEEAAGVSGLHSRRHEADLRLRAAEANLERLDDVMGELDAGLARIRREARQAEKYRRLSAEIRALQGAAIYLRWREANEALKAAEQGLRQAQAATGEAAGRVARATAQAVQAGDALGALRDEASIAAAVYQRMLIEKDRLERDQIQKEAAVVRLRTEARRLAADLAREEQIAEDAGSTLARLESELSELERALQASPTLAPDLEAAVRRAELDRAAADQAVEALASAAAANAARRQAAEDARRNAQARLAAAGTRMKDCEARKARIEAALNKSRIDLAAVSGPTGSDLALAQDRLAEAEARLENARAGVEAAESARAQAAAAEVKAREERRQVEDATRRLAAEAEGLRRLQAAGAAGGFATVLDAVTPDPGYEAALAAALGEDLDGALDPGADRFWAGASAEAPRWPKGAAPLADRIDAPDALAARLAFTALVEAADGERLQKVAPIGARLVSREGDLWRWDGFTVRARAATPAALRLEQRARLLEVETALLALDSDLSSTRESHLQAEIRAKSAEEALQGARLQPRQAERSLAEARSSLEALAREDAQREARREALTQACDRLQLEAADAEDALAAAGPELLAAEAALAASAPAPDALDDQRGLLEARQRAALAREAEARARARLDQERRSHEGRTRRREALLSDKEQWLKRSEASQGRRRSLGSDHLEVLAALSAAQETPEAAADQVQRLLAEFGEAEKRRERAADALAGGESAQAAAQAELRLAESDASAARETQAACEARRAAAADQTLALADQVRKTMKEEPEALGERLRREAIAAPASPDAVEAHLSHLERERDALGAVNLRAEEDMVEAAQRLEALSRERLDLAGAVARLRSGIETLNAEGRERLQEAFGRINASFQTLFAALFEGGQAELRLVESPDPLEAGLEIYACPPGKRLAAMSLMSGGEQALTATALIFAVFLANPSPICVLDEVDAPLDDANVDRFCRLLDEMRQRTQTRFIAITHHPVTMSRVDRLYGVTMPERGVSQLVSVDLRQAEAMAAE